MVMVCGNVVLPSGEPGQLPPTATFMIMKNGWSKTQRLPPMSAGVLREYATPSRYQVIESGAQSTANVWKASASACPPGSEVDAPTPLPPE